MLLLGEVVKRCAKTNDHLNAEKRKLEQNESNLGMPYNFFVPSRGLGAGGQSLGDMSPKKYSFFTPSLNSLPDQYLGGLRNHKTVVRGFKGFLR